MSDTSVFPIIIIIERERGRMQGLTLKAELDNRDNPKKLFVMIILFTVNLQDVQGQNTKLGKYEYTMVNLIIVLSSQ